MKGCPGQLRRLCASCGRRLRAGTLKTNQNSGKYIFFSLGRSAWPGSLRLRKLEHAALFNCALWVPGPVWRDLVLGYVAVAGRSGLLKTPTLPGATRPPHRPPGSSGSSRFCDLHTRDPKQGAAGPGPPAAWRQTAINEQHNNSSCPRKSQSPLVPRSPELAATSGESPGARSLRRLPEPDPRAKTSQF